MVKSLICIPRRYAGNHSIECEQYETTTEVSVAGNNLCNFSSAVWMCSVAMSSLNIFRIIATFGADANVWSSGMTRPEDGLGILIWEIGFCAHLHRCPRFMICRMSILLFSVLMLFLLQPQLQVHHDGISSSSSFSSKVLWNRASGICLNFKARSLNF